MPVQSRNVECWITVSVASFEVFRSGLKVQVFWHMILCQLVVLGLHGAWRWRQHAAPKRCYFRKFKSSHSFFTNLFVVTSFWAYIELKIDKCAINRSFIWGGVRWGVLLLYFGRFLNPHSHLVNFVSFLFSAVLQVDEGGAATDPLTVSGCELRSPCMYLFPAALCC